jgi:hypothetical protein
MQGQVTPAVQEEAHCLVEEDGQAEPTTVAEALVLMAVEEAVTLALVVQVLFLLNGNEDTRSF